MVDKLEQQIRKIRKKYFLIDKDLVYAIGILLFLTLVFIAGYVQGRGT